MPIVNDHVDADGDRILTTTDQQNREYEKVIFRKPVNLVVGLGPNNRVLPVKVNVSFRKGESYFGEELVWQLIFDGDDKDLQKVWRNGYRKKSPMNHIEFYFSGDIKKILNKINRLVDNGRSQTYQTKIDE